MATVSAEEAIRLSLARAHSDGSLAGGSALKAWETQKDIFKIIRPAYSEVNEPCKTVHVYVADNLSSLSFATPSDEADQFSALSKAEWSNFINLDRISSVTLHCDPCPGAGLAGKGRPLDGGVWCSINGPRVAWDRRVMNVLDKVTKETVPTVLGAPTGLEVATALAKGEKLRWVRIKATLTSASLPALPKPPPAATPADVTTPAHQEPAKVYAVVHLLGWSYRSEEKPADRSVSFQYSFEASVPVASDKFHALDSSEVAVEVYQTDKEGPKLLFVGTEPLTSIFKAPGSETGAGDYLHKAILSHQVSEHKLHLTSPGVSGGKEDKSTKEERAMQASVSLSLQAEFSEPSAHAPHMSGAPNISPELVGGGVNTSLFSSHRLAWYDPELGPGKFRPDHVANFAEISINSMRFPSDDKLKASSDDTDVTYYIRAKTSGVSVQSPALHRCQTGWSKVLGPNFTDPDVIRFEGHRLALPLPPGCWGADGSEKRKVEIEVVRCEKKSKHLDMSQFISHALKPDSCVVMKEEVVYKGLMTFDRRAMLDKSRSVSAFLSKSGVPLEVNVFSGVVTETEAPPQAKPDDKKAAESPQVKAAESQGMLNLDFCLRDRDHIRALNGQPGERRALCVGDKAMLVVEEPFLYPLNEEEFRRRFCIGSFDKSKGKSLGGKEWFSADKLGAPLREPCLSSEYSQSGLADIVPKVPFKQSFIPSFCEDIMPHRYVLPLSEKEHLDRNLPGFFPRIVENLVKNGKQEFFASSARKPIVSHLTHVNRQVLVAVLASYADGTYDVEVSTEFMKKWMAQTHRKFAFPGHLYHHPSQVNTGDEQAPPRMVLKKVSLTHLSAVHYTGINVYDAEFKTIDDVLRAPPPMNDFNPREVDIKQPNYKKQSEKFSIAAGPLPADASPAACLYEFSIRVRFTNEHEMHNFVSMLRRCVRVDHFQQASKMLEYQRKVAEAPKPVAEKHGPKVGGQLDVVLVEARRLKPLRSIARQALTSDPVSLYNSFMKPTDDEPYKSDQLLNANYLPELNGTTSGETVKGTPEGSGISTFVNFRLLHNREVVPYKGQKVQQSPVIDGTDSPCWSKKDELAQAGGWTFRTGTIDPERLPKLILDFEVMQASIGSAVRIGVIQLPVTEEMFLTNPNKLFKNLWLPLVSIKDGKPTPNVTGEIHIMTRWLPAEKMQVMADGKLKQQLSVRSMFMKEIWQKVCQQRIREPIYNLEAQYHLYNPNLVRPKEPVKDQKKKPKAEELKEHHRRHVEELANAVPYIECLERRQQQAWDEFEDELSQSHLAGTSIGECRLMWTESDDQASLQKVNSLVMLGVPSSRRPRIWAELTLASRVATMAGGSSHGASGSEQASVLGGAAAAKAADQEYQTLLQRGSIQESDAMFQLQEDAFILLGWETTVPPLPDALDVHMKRIKRAKNVVTALLACQDSNIAYCESLLVLAFFLLLPQGYQDEKFGTEESSLTEASESSVFWLLYTMVCTRINGSYREYYGNFAVNAGPDNNGIPNLCAGSGALQDVFLLECCLAYHENALWSRMNALGFQISTIFYGAFMRIFATYMPTASVFRFWDALFAQSTNLKAQPHARAYLINLAFAIIRSKSTELLLCESAYEMKSMILGTMGSLYDTSTVIDLVQAADSFLWGGSGFSSGKVGYLWTQRDDLFKGINTTIKAQNEILKQLMHLSTLRLKTSSAQDGPGVTTSSVVREVIPQLQGSLASLRQRGQPKYWAMHRPMPLTSKVMAENSFDKAWSVFSTSLAPPVIPPMPRMVGPPAGASRMPGLEPADVSSADLIQVLERELPGWGQHATALWNVFTNKPRTFGMGGNFGDQTLFGNNGAFGNDPYAQYNDSGGSFTNGQGMNNGSYGNPGNVGGVGYGVDEHGNPINRPTQTSAVGRWFGSLIGISDKMGDPNAPTPTGSEPESVSLNEIYTGLICASRGTLSEKAGALFNIYAISDPRGQGLNHTARSTRLAKTVASSTVDVQMELNRSAPGPSPESEEAKSNVLKLTVMTNYPTKDIVLGHVFVSSLSPFISTGPSPEKTYNIWGKQAKSTQRLSLNSQTSVVDQPVCIGELVMGIKWSPKLVDRPDFGTLSIHIKHVKFNEFYISDYYSINPWIEVRLCSDDVKPQAGPKTRKWIEMQRADPRSLRNTGTDAHWSAQGPYSGKLEFDQTVKDGMFGGTGNNFKNWNRHGAGQGFDKETGCWEWNEVWGKQHTKPIQVLSDFVALSTKRNVMDLQGTRLLVTSVLQRCMLNFSNRQAIMLADSIFNRSGAVPGILEAILVAGAMPAANKSMAQLKDEFDKAKTTYVDITGQLVLEHERQIQCNGGNPNLFAASYMAQNINLKHMNISDSFSGKAKVLYVRYVRGGDGERITQGIAVTSSGDVPKGLESEIKIVGEGEFPQCYVTKEEFVACVVEAPLLAESIRRLGSHDQAPNAKHTISIEVQIMDPHSEKLFEGLENALNIQQSLLLEVWDMDMMGKDFLGEAWLPPLSSFGPRAKDIVLPLKSADFSEDADNGSSRPDPEKEVGGDKNDPNMKISGNVFATVSWKYPMESDQGLDTELGEWLQDLEARGKLPADTLYAYKQDMVEKYGTLRFIADTKVTAKGEVEKDIFETLNIKDKKVHDMVTHWFKEHRAKETLLHRAKQQENMHTGLLTIKIDRATGLRRADAAKKRDCDPKARLWVRNDARAAWQKKPLLETATIRNDRNPTWNQEFKKGVLSGAFEAEFKIPHEGWGAEASRLSEGRKASRHRKEDRALASVKRFGAGGLSVKFLGTEEKPTDPAHASTEQPLGQNHRLEILLNDSVREFKDRVNDACQKELQYWKSMKGADSEEVAKYQDIDIGGRHVIMAYVPSPEVQSLIQKGLQGKPEFQRASQAAFVDPKNWQPLDLGMTFAQYSNKFGFGKTKQLLKIVEATESYKAINPRYKAYWEELNRISWQDTNTNRMCIGWAPYAHKNDGNSLEYRPAFISQGSPPTGGGTGGGTEEDKLRISWVFPGPRPATDPAVNDAVEVVHEELKSSVLFAPRIVKFDNSMHPAHKEVLVQAKLLRQSGKSVWEIEAVLNKMLDDKWVEEQKKPDKDEVKKPDRITVDQIRGYLQRIDEQALAASQRLHQ
ncbi:unnamed protein product [Polarella glacialis]|uniref:Rab-GAP TBC domain-containing protein n=1 Tax=Polarella glacialis TaxID=89957 RepID=A0A813F0E3_POLGL|nr:unnamed protein product [Polarella glacialis]